MISSEEALSYLDNLAASQKPRVFDMFALGPLLLWASTRSRKLGRWERRALFGAGVFTVLYNYRNYKNVREIVAQKLEEAGV